VHLKLTVFDPIVPKGMDIAVLAKQIEEMIRKELGQ